MILLIALIALTVFLAVILARAAAFTPKEVKRDPAKPVRIDGDKAVSNLQQLVRCRTVSYHDRSLEDDAEFDRLTGLIPSLYPNVVKTCEKIEVHRRALLYLWKGTSHGAADAEASVLMAHYDVVTVEEKNWEKPPFEGIIENGVLWGRGTLDTKVTFNGILMAADQLIAEGFTPKEDIYLAFSGGEETNGPGAAAIVDYFKEKKIRLSMVVDEGGAVVENVFPGVKEQCALIGIAEKGMMDLSYRTGSNGGHASAPAPHTPVGVLARAVTRVENHPLPMHITPPVAQMFDTLGRRSTFAYRILFANLWCFAPVLGLITKKSGGEFNALVRTTCAFTCMKGSEATNVIPPSAEVVSNIRINPAETVSSVIEAITRIIGDGNVRLEPLGDYASDPSPVSRTDVPGWERVVSAVSDTWENTVVSPYLMVQCSDSRHYRDISDRVYKFSAMHLTKEERGLIHGSNERITLPAVGKAVEFFYRLIQFS